MPTYAIGDVQGCYRHLCQLLEKINFNIKLDKLWFCGDLVNRGPESLATLRFIKSLAETKVAHCVLGNHDIHLLAVAANVRRKSKKDTFSDILSASDRSDLLDWLRHQPLIHYDSHLNSCIVHAGIPPVWTLDDAQKYGQEVSNVLQQDNYKEVLERLFGDEPLSWNEQLEQEDKLRFTVNALTRMRYWHDSGRLCFQSKGSPQSNTLESKVKPWFQQEVNYPFQLLFGHWAALRGECDVNNVVALDTGCVWGGDLTAYCVETKQYYSVSGLT